MQSNRKFEWNKIVLMFSIYQLVDSSFFVNGPALEALEISFRGETLCDMCLAATFCGVKERRGIVFIQFDKFQI